MRLAIGIIASNTTPRPRSQRGDPSFSKRETYRVAIWIAPFGGMDHIDPFAPIAIAWYRATKVIGWLRKYGDSRKRETRREAGFLNPQWILTWVVRRLRTISPSPASPFSIGKPTAGRGIGPALNVAEYCKLLWESKARQV